jgi:hypothetical protein
VFEVPDLGNTQLRNEDEVIGRESAQIIFCVTGRKMVHLFIMFDQLSFDQLNISNPTNLTGRI